ncbi:hypothetical protein OHD16_20570 [Sphingobacterium sp. ML3W]|uniref:DUF6882 domain-containing protein n=1 Tax=Sphingobacterium sp. ML3W TaxID=1538644 RepID=UPI00249B6FCB|nr:DUF6882 domain-containing protein [Sphingobacterium sp. ML3W]WFA82356.1 hypothetical protein OGI71_13710 [Sphingobacterium sp. ML3W]
MGFLNKLFGKGTKIGQGTEAEQGAKIEQGAKVEQVTSTKGPENSLACCTEQELIERFGGIAFDKQYDFATVISNNNWNIDMTKEEISFGPNLDFPIQVLGTFSHSSETWLWAWANTKSGLSENITQQALQLKKYGEDQGIDLFSNNSFDFSKDELHRIGLIASGMFDASAYYIADYGQGAMLVTIKSNVLDRQYQDDHLRILSVFPQLISQFEMNHKIALQWYLEKKGYKISEQGAQFIATKGGDTITAEFDELSRLTNLNG